MTKQFDTLLEQMLSEMMPADIGEIGFGGASERIKAGVPKGEAKGHWAPLQKLSQEDRDKVIDEILKEVFSEKENSYAPTVDSPEDLHSAIQTAIQKVSSKTALKASAKYASKFLADRLMTLLKNVVKYTTSSGVETLQKEMTQKEFKQALKKALEEPAAEEVPATTEPSEKEQEAEGEEVYFKTKDWTTDDAKLQAIYDKLPDDKDMSWEEVLKLIKLTPADELEKAGGLSKETREVEAGEEEYGSKHKELELDDEDDADLSRFDRFIDPYFNTTRRAGGPLGWD